MLGGGPSAEHEISLKTAEQIYENLNPEKYEMHLATITHDGTWLVAPFLPMNADAACEKIKGIADIVFIALHGEYGEDGTVQKLFEKHDICYTGSGPEASFTGMHKILSRAHFRATGLNVPKSFGFNYQVYERAQNDILSVIANNFLFPVIAKPTDRGSSVGVSIVETISNLGQSIHNIFHYSPNAAAEEFIEGREITCGVIERRGGKIIQLLPTEIIPKKSLFFDYESKYSDGGAEEITPARIPKSVLLRAQETAVVAHKALGCRGYSRTDMIWNKNDGKFYVLEINTLPGLTQASIFPKAAIASGIRFSELLDRIIETALF